MKQKSKALYPTDEQREKPSKKRRVIFSGLWLVLWPTIMLLPAIAAFIGGLFVAQLIIGSEAEYNQQFTSALQIGIFVGVALLVIASFLFKRFLRNRKRYFFRSGGTVLGVYVWIGMLVGGISMIGVGFSPDVAKPPVSQDKNLMQILADVGGDQNKMSNVSMSYVDDYKDGFEGQAGEYTPYLDNQGNFSHGLITIKKGLNTDEEKVLVAHEYLHHIWEAHIEPETLRQLTSQLMTMYGKDINLQDRVGIYSDTDALTPSELFAYYCTESSDQHLSQYVLEQCNKYINRSVLNFAR